MFHRSKLTVLASLVAACTVIVLPDLALARGGGGGGGHGGFGGGGFGGHGFGGGGFGGAVSGFRSGSL
jgi:hypothetical protein